MSRGKNPSENTIRMLCGKAAGMCEFEGCGKRLFYDDVTLSEFNNAFVAHIIASSKNGPRGDAEQSHKLSDKIENLMLMCADHHKLIDIPSTGPRDYPVERLKEMKRNHEEKIERICGLFNVPKTSIVMFSSPIKGKISVNIDHKLAAKAVLPNKQPDSPYGINIPIYSRYDYRSKEYWEDCLSALKVQFNINLYNPLIQLNKSDFSIFPIAPIPLIIKLGELIGDKLPCEVYQKTRIPDTWEWQSNKQTNTFDIYIDEINPSNNAVALVLSLTDDISIDRIMQTGKYGSIYKIRANTLGVDCIKSTIDLSLFWHKFQEVCDLILNSYGNECIINLFPAIPVSAAFEIGRRYMPNTYPVITIFDEDNGFFKTLKLGG